MAYVYARVASYSVGYAVSTAELTDFMTDIWYEDINAATDVRVSVQGHTSSGSTTDHASHG